MNRSAPTWNDWWVDQLGSSCLIDPDLAHRCRNAPFLLQARPAQRPPQHDWRTWLFMGGRGAGKTRAGAEWTRFAALFGQAGRIALVGPTLGDVREVMVDGPSGLRWIEPDHRPRPVYIAARRRLEWSNGAKAYAFSAEEPERLRGPQFHAAWCDEIGVWAKGEAVWNNLQLGLRLGHRPRCVATTTPRPVPLVQRLVNSDAVVTHARTQDNARYLAPEFVAQMQAIYAGTLLGRQELDGELIEDLAGALWQRSDIARQRVYSLPARFDDLVLAMDPPTTSHSRSDACGIIVAGRAATAGFGERCFILADATVQGAKPADWASRAVALGRDCGVSRIIAEANQGGEMVRTVLESVGCDLPIVLKHARLGKAARAAPVAALYQKGLIAHVGDLRALEDEMCRFGADGFVGSPDRVDALVWAITSLMFGRDGAPRIRQL
ncbi:MAG: terminase family protein [Pseudomonadota bacterium]